MKRGGAEVAPAHLERVRRTPQWCCSHRYQAQRRWRRVPLRFVKMCQHQRQGVLLCSSAAASIGRQSMGCCMWRQSVGCWMSCGMHVNWPCGGVKYGWWDASLGYARIPPWRRGGAQHASPPLRFANGLTVRSKAARHGRKLAPGTHWSVSEGLYESPPLSACAKGPAQRASGDPV